MQKGTVALPIIIHYVNSMASLPPCAACGAMPKRGLQFQQTLSGIVSEHLQATAGITVCLDDTDNICMV